MTSTLGALGRGLRNVMPVPAAPRGAGLSLLQPNAGASTRAMQAFGQVGTLFSIVSKLATSTASPEWKLYRKATSEDSERTRVMSHAALSILGKPNGFYTRFLLFEAVQQHVDLTGEGWLVIGRDPRFPSIPLELWCVRPDRIEPVPDAEEFIVGYVYTSPDGQRVPLDRSDVMRIVLPNPLDPYRGMGPVQSLLLELEIVKATSSWNLNFFKNSAEPGGIVKVPRRLGQVEFEELRDRWNDQHRGVSNAHRVAILENAEWVERKITQRDMQFAELRNISDEQIRKAFAFPKPMLGDTDTVNLANALASEHIYGTTCIRPRLNRWRELLNTQFLPLFGSDAAQLEFDYESPVPEDEEAENAERTSKAQAFSTYVAAGVHPDDAAALCDLPPVRVERPQLAVAPRARAPHTQRPRGAVQPEDEDLPDVQPVQEEWEAALALLLAGFGSIVLTSWFPLLVEQVRALAGFLPGVTGLTLPRFQARETLTSAMVDLAGQASAGAVREAGEQDVSILPGTASADLLAARASLAVDFLADDYLLSAKRECLRVGPDAEQLEAHLSQLTTARQELYLGASLTQAQHAGRLATFASGPVAAYYASEQLDTNTCKFCKDVHGKWLGNDLTTEVPKTYPLGGYVSCQGRQRCRGQVVAIYRGGNRWIEREPV